MDDREVVAAIAAGDPAGIAVAYDRYADALYSYCHWMLRQPQDAADAMVHTFVFAAATLGGLPEAPKLRPWLYAVARNECLHRPRTRSAVGGEEVHAARRPAHAADRSADVGRDPGQAELRTLILTILAELKPLEREIIELILRHELYDADLAVALGVSWSRAHALASHALGHLEKALGTLLVASAGRGACPALDTLLADWDGQLTKQTRKLVGGHISQCKTCTDRKWGKLRPAALAGLLPQAARSPGLRERVLGLCSSTSHDTVAYQRAESTRHGVRLFDSC